MNPREHETELLLVNLGTPTAPTPAAVRAFLAEFLGDPMVVELPRLLWLPILYGPILTARPKRVAELYRSIWSDAGPPLAVATERIAAAVQRELDELGELGERARVTAAFRYGRPSLEERIDAALARAERVVVTSLFPQRTASSSGTVERLVERLRAERPDGARLAYARLAPDEPRYLAALAERFTAATAGAAPEHLVLSFHGIPLSVDRRERSRYRTDCEATSRALLELIGWDPARATLCFQSRFGPAKWLEPATDRVLAELPRQGVKRVAVMAPGFLTEGLETLEELGVRGKETFEEAGGEHLTLVPAPTDHPALARALAALVQS